VRVSEGKERYLKSVSPFEREPLTVISPKIFAYYPGVRAGMSTKLEGSAKQILGMNMSYKVGDVPSQVKKNRDAFLSRMEILESELAVPFQCHSPTVLRVDRSGEYDACDALITNQKNVALAVLVADCVPLLLFDPIHSALGAVHAGWRGTVDKIVPRTVEKMKVEYQTNPKQLKAFIGPSAGKCCYEIGEEVAVMFGIKIVSYEKKRYFLDLKEENRSQLQQQGVPRGNIETSGSCTICENHVFHSYRRDGKSAGRMMAVICLRQ
jgi:YfiH family protein